MKQSINGNLILTPYKKTRELKTSQETTGFAMVANKIGIESLELLVDTVVKIGNNSDVQLKKGSKIFFKEETLYTQPWSKQVFESETFPEGFIVADINHVLFVESE